MEYLSLKHAYEQYTDSAKEGYQGKDVDRQALLLSLMIVLAVYVYAVFLVYKHFKELEGWAKVVALSGLVFGYPLLSVITVFSMTGQWK